MSSNKRMYVIAGILLVIIVGCLLILSNVYINENTGLPEEKKVMIETSTWPIQDVPVINKPNLDVRKFSSDIQIQEVKKGVSYEEFVDYLYDLCDAGFEPDSFYGCKHPSMLNAANVETIDELTWIGTSEKYDITATWMKEGTSDRVDNVMVSLFWKEDPGTPQQ